MVPAWGDAPVAYGHDKKKGEGDNEWPFQIFVLGCVKPAYLSVSEQRQSALVGAHMIGMLVIRVVQLKASCRSEMIQLLLANPR